MDLLKGQMGEILSSRTISTRQRQIAKMAKEAPEMSFWSLSKHLDMEWLREAYRQTRKTGAAGIDGQTGKEYGEDLEKNLETLLNRAKGGTYRAPPVRRTVRRCG